MCILLNKKCTSYSQKTHVFQDVNKESTVSILSTTQSISGKVRKLLTNLLYQSLSFRQHKTSDKIVYLSKSSYYCTYYEECITSLFKTAFFAQMEKKLYSVFHIQGILKHFTTKNWQSTDCTGKCGNHYTLRVWLTTWLKWERDCWQICQSFESLERSQREFSTVLIENQNYQKFT